MTKHTISRRALLTGAGAIALSAAVPHSLFAEGLPTIAVEKDPGCGCCTVWVDMARKAGFEVTVTEETDYVGMKRRAGVPDDLWSCHTARVDGYIVEGHVPYAAIRKLLADRPNILGISVPGMPGDSPGMGGAIDAVVPVTAWGGDAGAGAPFLF